MYTYMYMCIYIYICIYTYNYTSTLEHNSNETLCMRHSYGQFPLVLSTRIQIEGINRRIQTRRIPR